MKHKNLKMRKSLQTAQKRSSTNKRIVKKYILESCLLEKALRLIITKILQTTEVALDNKGEKQSKSGRDHLQTRFLNQLNKSTKKLKRLLKLQHH